MRRRGTDGKESLGSISRRIPAGISLFDSTSMHGCVLMRFPSFSLVSVCFDDGFRKQALDEITALGHLPGLLMRLRQFVQLGG